MSKKSKLDGLIMNVCTPYECRKHSPPCAREMLLENQHALSSCLHFRMYYARGTRAEPLPRIIVACHYLLSSERK